jgi:8-oxo-dGTP pyrophosphatase MutT (NUDIX family)
MDFEPQKFFVGLMDFFSILLPGALLTFLLKTHTGVMSWSALQSQSLDGAKGWIAFLVASYLLGHFAFLLGSWLDEFYDWLRRRTLDEQIKQIVRRGRNFRWGVRVLVWLTFKRERNLAVERAGKIKERSLFRLRAKKSVNNFQWSKAFLTIESPESLAVVQRFEADSKFFRCFVIVLLVMIGLSWSSQDLKLAVAGVLLLPLAMWRYMEQRFKATNQAYWSVITLTAQKSDLAIVREPAGANQFTHAGGVVFRQRLLQGVQYLLVEASKNPDELVLPKGKIEPGEDTRETAVREVHEETGVWARIRQELDTSSYSVKGETVKVQFYLMEQVARGFRSDRTREKEWLSLTAAKDFARHEETRRLLDLADQRRQGK